MSKITEKLKKEWERAVLMFVALMTLLLLSLAAWHMLKNESGDTGPGGVLPTMPNYFDTNNFACIKPVKDLSPAVNPMRFRRQLAIPKAPEPPKPPVKQPDKQPDKPPVKPGDKPVAQPPGKAPDKPPAPERKEPPWIITVKYRGLYKGITGKELAFIDAKNSKGNRQAQTRGRSFYLSDNGRVYDAMTVRSFDKDQLTLSYGKGGEVILKLGKEEKVTIDD
jgi:hypothetical protein